MCEHCDGEVNQTRVMLEKVIDAERRRQSRPGTAGLTSAQQTIRLAGDFAEAYQASGHDLPALCLGFALTVHKLLAVQEIYGIPVV